MQGDLSILYALMGVVILLALIAALGAWVRGGGLKRDEAENLFSDSQDRHREEVSRLEKIIEESRRAAEEAQAKTESAIAAKLREIDEQVGRTKTTIQAAVSQASTDQSASLSEELELVTTRIGESERRMSSNISDMTSTLQNVQMQVSQAGDQMRATLMEITRQQQEQKAQSTIQLCEALITSLGTLKSSISHQLTDNTDDSTRTVDAEADNTEMPGLNLNENDTEADENSGFDGDESTFSEFNLSKPDAGDDYENREQDNNDELRREENDYSEGGESTLDTTAGNIEVEQEPRAFNWGDAALESSEETQRAGGEPQADTDLEEHKNI